MARKVIDITHSASQYDILSQTPKNYSGNNYFLKELQDKIDAEWEYRPNRVDVEYEESWGEQSWSPLEAVIQSVKSEKGTAISDDCKNLVFRDILEKRFKIGSRFRFSPRYLLSDPDIEKNIWLVTNMNSAKITSSVVIERCNGILGSTYINSQGVSEFHYEPVIQGRDLSAVNLFYNETAVSPQSQLLITAQYNEFTKSYKINQRFIIGTRYFDEVKQQWVGQVYRIKAINRFYANSTNVPEDVGLIRIYLELTESGPYEDWENRIAYQQEPVVHIYDDGNKDGYSIIFKTPESIPVELFSTPVIFTPSVVDKNGTDVPEMTSKIEVSWALENLPATADKNKFINFASNLDGNVLTFTISRKRIYLNGDLIISCKVNAEDSLTEKEILASFAMVVRNQEV